MPRCYLFAIAHLSSVDRETDNFSLYQIIERIGVESLPALLPLQAHVFFAFEPDEYDRDYELRFVFAAPSAPEIEGMVARFRSPSGPRFRVRTPAFPLPGPGVFAIYPEWREVGAEVWTRAVTGWPLDVRLLGSDETGSEPARVPPPPSSAAP